MSSSSGIWCQVKRNIDFITELTDALITAQAFVFFAAGFETSASTISHALLELAQNQDIQDRLRKEIKESLKANNHSVTYDSVKEMKYLDMVFQGTAYIKFSQMRMTTVDWL